ncbi:MAG: alanine racemase [Gammaproteobacteria bacterium]|nr:alanine racemase [Gammaproteobacteria bacterium]
MRPTKAIIHRSAIQHNLEQIKKMAPQSRIMAVVKADAYGHGLVPIAKSLAAADALAVACIEEAIELRNGGVTTPIILLEGIFESNELPLVAQLDLQLVIHNQHQIDLLKANPTDKPIEVWLKVDTHMNRLGFAADSIAEVFESVQQLPSVSVLRLMTHFACADDVASSMTQQQLDLFKSVTAEFDVEKSAANSAAVLAWPETHFDWVRPGLMLYGYSPLLGKEGHEHKLLPAMTLESKLFEVKTVEKGESVGYGAHWRAEHKTTIGIVAIGYGDGYPRHVENDAPVWVNGRIVPIAGRVSMDMFAVNLGEDSKDSIGDRVVLWGPELPVERVALAANTIPYTLVCGVTARVKYHWSE